MLERSGRELSVCSQHLAENRAKSLPTQQLLSLERILVGYILTIIHSELEAEIREAVQRRCHVANDASLNRFVRSAADRLIRSIRIEQLSGLLGYFGEDCKQRFQDGLTDQMVASYDSLESNRQSFAHQTGSNATLQEVQTWFIAAQDVIDAFCQALSAGPSGT